MPVCSPLKPTHAPFNCCKYDIFWRLKFLIKQQEISAVIASIPAFPRSTLAWGPSSSYTSLYGSWQPKTSLCSWYQWNPWLISSQSLQSFYLVSTIRLLTNHNSPIFDECQSHSAKVLALPRARAHQDDCNGNNCNQQLSFKTASLQTSL